MTKYQIKFALAAILVALTNRSVGLVKELEDEANRE